MATNQNVIAISIKAFLPTGKTLDEQFAALSIVKTAHETGDYSALLKAAQDVQIKTEAKTRRVEEHPGIPHPAAPVAATEGANIHGIGPDEPTGPNSDYDPAFTGDVIPTAPEDFALAAEPAPAPKKR